MSGLMAIGAAVLKVVGLNPQRLGTRSETRVPGAATFSGMDFQLTGAGPKTSRIEFATWPAMFGGMDALAILKLIHQQQTVVPLLRLGANYAGSLEGLVVVQFLDVGEERFHPRSGVGRIVHGEAELLHVGSATSLAAGVLGTGLGAAVKALGGTSALGSAVALSSTVAGALRSFR